MSKSTVLIFSLFITIHVASCGTTKPYSPAELYSNPSTVSIKGIKHYLADLNGPPLQLMMLHGMCHHPKDWAEDTITKIANELNLTKQLTECSNEVGDECHGYMRYSFNKDTTPALEVFALNYSWITKEDKRKALCFDVSKNENDTDAVCPNTDRTYEYERATINRDVKHKLINECLSDVALYAGERKLEIQDEVKKQMQTTLSLNKQDGIKPPLFIWTESLGSKVMFDIILPQTKPYESLNTESMNMMSEMANTKNIYMGANQLPLLGLADKNQYIDGEYSIYEQLEKFATILNVYRSSYYKNFSAQSEILNRLNLIAFTDPNDLLSYTLDFKKIKIENANLLNVIVSNDKTYQIPFDGSVENPWPAHTGYSDNDDVIHYLINDIDHTNKQQTN